MTTHFICEVSNNHNGSLANAKRLILAARDAGASWVKFQAFDVDELCTLRGGADVPAPAQWAHMTMRELYSRAQTPLEWFPELASLCADHGMPWFSSVFGARSLDVLEECGCVMYKVARLDNQAGTLSRLVRMTGKPIIVSTAGEVPVLAREHAAHLWCPVGYPQADYGFRPGLFSEYDGFSYHGTDIGPCVEAAGLGAKLIEAHVQLDQEPSILESNISLRVSDFKRLVDVVRRCES